MGEYVQSILDLQEAIEPLIDRTKYPYPRWIVTPDGDLGSEWCSDCGTAKVRNLRRRDRRRREDYILDGGWRTEEEHFCFCEGCGVRLDVGLTEYGIREEIAHYEECGLCTEPGVNAYEISEILAGLDYRSDDERDDLSELRERAEKIARLFVSTFTPATGDPNG